MEVVQPQRQRQLHPEAALETAEDPLEDAFVVRRQSNPDDPLDHQLRSTLISYLFVCALENLYRFWLRQLWRLVRPWGLFFFPARN